MKGWYTFCRNVSSSSGFPVIKFPDSILKVVHFAQESVVHFRQELLVHFAQESLVQFGQEYSIYETAYNYILNELLKDQLIGKYLDMGCYNLDRGCFLSYDPHVYRNPDPQQWQISGKVPLVSLVPNALDESAIPSNPVESMVLLDRIHDFYVKSGKSLFNDHQTWKDGGYMFFNFFVEREDLAEHFYRKFSALSDKYDEKQFDKTVKSIKKRKDKPNSTLVWLMKTCVEDGFKFEYQLKEIQEEISAFYRRYRRVFFNQKALQINDYISEYQINENKNLIIISPTNSGKTRYFFSHLQGKRILLVPTKVNVDELVAKYSTTEHPVKGIYEGIQVDINDQIMVGTFDAIQKFNRILPQEEYQLWVDEYHHFYTSGDKNFRNEVLNELYSSMFAYKRVVLMSGTDLDDDFLFNTQPDPLKTDWYNDKYTFTKLVFEKRNVKQKNLTIVETDDSYASIIERMTHEGLNLIYFNDKERSARFAEIISKGGYAVQLVNADNKSTEEVQAILKTGKVDEKVKALLVTSILQECASLYNEATGVHFLGNPTHVDIEQMVNRFRIANPNIYLYIKRDEIYSHRYLDRKFFLKTKMDEAQRQVDYYKNEMKAKRASLPVSEVISELEQMTRIIRDSAESLVMERFGDLQIDKIAVANRLYENMRQYQHEDILQLLFNLVQYNYTFSFESAHPADKKIIVRGKKMSVAKMKKYYNKVIAENFHRYEGKNSSDLQFRKFCRRYEYIADHLPDGCVWDAMEKYGRSDKDFKLFQKKIKSQIYYASKGYTNGKSFKINKITETGTIKRFYNEFELDQTYMADEVITKVISIKKDSPSMRGVKLTKNKATRWLKEMFEVEQNKSNGKYSYTIKSLNVSGFPLDQNKRSTWDMKCA